MGTSTLSLTGGSIPANGSCQIKVDVTASKIGAFENTLPVGSLQTSTGNNMASAGALLTVNCKVPTPPTLTKKFHPNKIQKGETSTLTLTLKNPSSVISNLTAPLIDNFPLGLLISGSSSTTCGGALTAQAGSSKLILTGGVIPAKGSCEIKVKVTGKEKGCFKNVLDVGALQTSTGSNDQIVDAVLSVD